MTILNKFIPTDFNLNVKKCKKCSLNLIKLFLVPITKYFRSTIPDFFTGVEDENSNKVFNTTQPHL
jgi:hypothetical protein